MKIIENDLNEVVKVNNQIPEFDPYDINHFTNRIAGKDSLSIVAYVENIPVGYIVGYKRDQDNSFYCWMAGVIPAFRKKGVLRTLMDYEEIWAKEQGYTKIKIKTRNNKREMILYLTKYGFNFTEVEQRSNIQDNRIMLEKEI